MTKLTGFYCTRPCFIARVNFDVKSSLKAFDNEQAATNHRHDLGGHVESKVHNLSQLMWPSLYVPELSQVIEKCVSVAKVTYVNLNNYNASVKILHKDTVVD